MISFQVEKLPGKPCNKVNGFQPRSYQYFIIIIIIIIMIMIIIMIIIIIKIIIICECAIAPFKGAVLRNSAKLGNYKMPVKLRET